MNVPSQITPAEMREGLAPQFQLFEHLEDCIEEEFPLTLRAYNPSIRLVRACGSFQAGGLGQNRC